MEKSSTLQLENHTGHDEKVPDQESNAVVSSEYPNVDEAAVLRKMDVRLIPMLSVLYLLAFLDRGNIGNAKIEGLLEDLNMTGPQYNWTCMCSLLDHIREVWTNVFDA